MSFLTHTHTQGSDDQFEVRTSQVNVMNHYKAHARNVQYLSDYFQHVAFSNRRRLRSSSSSLLLIRRTRLITVGDRAFPVAGSRLWNSHVVTSAPTLVVFRKRLKTYLFSRSFAL